MILDLAYISRDLYLSNQVRIRPTYLSGLEATGLHTRAFVILVDALADEVDVHTRDES